MKKRHRFWGAGIAASVALMSIVGCTAAAYTPPSPANTPVELTMLIWPGMDRASINEAIRVYTEQHPNVTIRVKEEAVRREAPMSPNVGVEETGSITLPRDTAAPPTDPLEGVDIALLPQVRVKNLASGALKDLSHVALPQLDETIAGLFDDLSKTNGKRLSLPYAITPSLLTVDEDVMKQTGVALPSLDWTVQEFEQTILALSQTGKAPDLNMVLFLEPIVRAYGGRIYDAEKDAWAFDTPEGRAGLEALARMVKTGVFQNTSGGTRVPMRVGPYQYTPAVYALPLGMVLPMEPAANQPYPSGPSGRAVPATALVATVAASTAHPDAAIDFVTKLIGNEAMQTALAGAGIRPVLPSEKAHTTWQQVVGEKVAQATNLSLQGAYAQPDIYYYDLLEKLKPFLHGQTTLEQLMPTLLAAPLR